MAKKMIYVIVLVVILFVGISIGYAKTYAATSTVDDVIKGADDFLEKGSDDAIQTIQLKDTSDFIFNIFLAIAIVIAVIVGMVIGIKFMMAGIEEKAEIKETLVPYFIGCIVVFGAFGIWKLVITILNHVG